MRREVEIEMVMVMVMVMEYYGKAMERKEDNAKQANG